ncbi:MAG: Ankyrin repeat [Phormidesmis priestleyi Ana]|uniref:Ankyrin repeat n=1 Tax=Phormidesmis priestleyi Ana TaxID=1666911 RepID=A0A0P8DLG5_9CYAN|nr:MAG: Ankyrin repeat [Phormidesmis priestleyi Ana]
MLAIEQGNTEIIHMLCAATANHPRPAQIFFDTSPSSTPSNSHLTNSHLTNSHLNQSASLIPPAYEFSDNGVIASPISVFAPIAPTFSNQTEQTEQTEQSEQTKQTEPTSTPAQNGFSHLPSHMPEATQKALETAVRQNDLSAVKALLKAGASLYPKNWYDEPVLVTAAAKGYAAIVQELIIAGANVNSGYDRLPLHIAAENGHLEVVQRLIYSGADVHAKEGNGQTALIRAAIAGQLEVVRELVANGANTNTVCQGETALMVAARNGHLAVCQFLSPYVATKLFNPTFGYNTGQQITPEMRWK